ncbi:MAG: hypothetical protein M1827_005737 [Pycnora praestabilis]|nr:MAG: hypothetical protein M1827_005737 [Pycnora praestabilis]
MSGLEVVAVVACVAAVVSAYGDGGAILQRIKEKRRAKRAAPPTRYLEESLARGPRAVEEAKENGVERYGRAFAVGDDVAVIALQSILLNLQSSLLRHLLHAQEDDNMVDFTILIDASDMGRIQAVSVLSGLHMRLATAAPPIEIPHQSSLASDTKSDRAIQGQGQAPITSSANPRWSMPSDNSENLKDGANHTAEGHHRAIARPLMRVKRTSISSNIKSLFSPSSKRTFSTGSTDCDPMTSRMNSSRLEHVEADLTPSVYSDTSNTTWALTPAPLLSHWHEPDNAPPEIERNPWQDLPLPSEDSSDLKASASGGRQLESSRPLPERSLHSLSVTTLPSSENGYGGFCKGAYYLQVGLRKEAVKLRNQSVSFQGEGYYWACASSKCAFEGRAIKKSGWVFDDTVRTSHGIRYRWSFLAKSHIVPRKVQLRTCRYRCIFCASTSVEGGAPLFQKVADLMEHILQHCGQSLDYSILQRISCVSDRLAADDEGFDINLAPSTPELAYGLLPSSSSPPIT